MKKKLIYFIIPISIWIALAYSTFFIFEYNTIYFLAREDGVFESLTSIFFFSASVMFFISFVKNKSGCNIGALSYKKNIFFVLLAIVFLFGAGEEISWGQRIFNLEVPDVMLKYNNQNEINFHNLDLFAIDRMYSIFWLTFAFLIPLSCILNKTFNRFIRKVGIPVIPVWFGIFFLINYTISKLIEPQLLGKMSHYLVETKECNGALIFVFVSAWLLANFQSETQDISNTLS